VSTGGLSSRVGTGLLHIIPHNITAQTAIDLPGLVRQGAGRIGGYLASQFGAVLRNIALFLFELVVMLFALFYFCVMRKQL